MNYTLPKWNCMDYFKPLPYLCMSRPCQAQGLVNITQWPLPLHINHTCVHHTKTCHLSLFADSCQSLMPIMADPVARHQNSIHLLTLWNLCLLQELMEWFDYSLFSIYNQSNLLYKHCVGIIFVYTFHTSCPILSSFRNSSRRFSSLGVTVISFGITGTVMETLVKKAIFSLK